ncbi:MAG TPA: isoprenylcysteine carboxylmethyltransferase family protein [Rhizomicrobium sp.]|jgi:protein-S-isoprenylcysteine O-methyltransferase Ste14|nr:isoprenylcysteine carboxylmethyltransferase family protein [Rhizomicrobium sp.]
MRPDEAIYIPWVLWIFSWFAAARWANQTTNRPPFGSQALYRTIEVAGFMLLLFYVARRMPDGDIRPVIPFPILWTLPDAVKWAMVGVCAFGFLFCWWARIHLGVLWSGSVTRKEGHHVVDTGPYAIVRHPIYTGIIISALATMAVRGNIAAVAGVVLIVIAYWIKGRLEERFLRGELGAEAYDAYARKTAMLIPFVRL